MKQFPKIQVDDRKLAMIQDAVVNAINPLLQLPLSDSNLLEGVVLASGTNRVEHKLGRSLRGWFVTRNNASVTFYDTQSSNPLPDLYLNIVASGAATVDLIVY